MSKSTAPGFNNPAMLPPVELFVGSPLWDDPRVPESSSGPPVLPGPRNMAASPWCSQPPNLPPPPLKPAHAPRPGPQPRHMRGSTGRRRSCFTREQADRLQGSWPSSLGLGSGNHSLIHSFIHLFIQLMLKCLLCTSYCSRHWGFSECRRNPCHSVPGAGHLHPGVEVSGL